MGRKKENKPYVTPKTNLVGQTINNFTVLEQAPDHISASGHHYAKWLCQCKCGRITEVLGYRLKPGGTQSCGCARGKEIVGKDFGALHVIRATNESKKGLTLYECQCSCGNTVKRTRDQLIHNQDKTCGNCRSCGLEDLVGRQFGLWTVLEKVPNTGRSGKGRSQWLCQCQCGTKRIVGETQLTRDRTHSCGCLRGHDPSKERQPVTSHLGETKMMCCGLMATIVRVNTYTDIDVCFEDGALREGVNYNLFEKRHVRHPQWERTNPKGGEFNGFTEIHLVYGLPNAVYYRCRRPDGIKDILTPQQMLAWKNGETPSASDKADAGND